MTKMTCEQFDFDLWNEGFYDEVHSEMYWNDSFSTQKVFNIFKKEAEKRNIELTDVEDWDYEKIFWDGYKNNPDKGLS